MPQVVIVRGSRLRAIRHAVRGGIVGSLSDLASLAITLALAAPGFAQDNVDGQSCPGDGDPPVPVEVTVTTVPIVVTSTTADYFVLYVSHDLEAGTAVEFPVLVKRGEEGATTLAENLEALPVDRYRVEKYSAAEPADIDGDCIDDIAELADPVGRNPVNPGIAVELTDGAVAVPDRATFETLAFGGFHLKFLLSGMDTDSPVAYFMNVNTHLYHHSFLKAVGLEQSEPDFISGNIFFHHWLGAPSGTSGVYGVLFKFRQRFDLAERAYTLLAANMPFIEDNLAFHLPEYYLLEVQEEMQSYRESRIKLLFDEDLRGETHFLALNTAGGFGLLQTRAPDERPHPRDIVVYEALPNELSRVAGIISTVPQTPLSHVNLRAVQNGIPNAFIRDALSTDSITSLVGDYVRYEVTESGWDLRAATPEEVDEHYASSRPPGTQTPRRNLSVTAIRPLSEMVFGDWSAYGVKAANLAVLRTLGFPDGTVPDGFAIPFYFYDEFMKAHGFYGEIDEMLADENFRRDFEVQDDMLDDLRDDIKDAETSQWIIEALTAMHGAFPAGTSLRYRSSTNSEDLRGFNGAGLYDSKTQNPDETEEDGIDKSLKQVFASLWTFRAFTEREFHRIDHKAAAMGVLVHPNYTDELANGVAVSFDPVRSWDAYYVNTQLGEDLVTNPEAHSVPEELLVQEYGVVTVLSLSNLVERGQLLMTEAQIGQLREHLEVIHERFEELYDPAADEPFAMEIEFKITSDDVLAIKQARPWVFGVDWSSVPGSPPGDPPEPPPPSGGGGGGGGVPPSDGDDDDEGNEGDAGDEDDGAGGGGGGGAPPRAAIMVDAVCAEDLCRARTGKPVTFTDTSSGFVRLRRWEFGDGTRRSGRTVDYAWAEPGFYEVSLWTSDGRDESIASRVFLVEASEPAGTCGSDAETRCLQDSRFAVRVDWWSQDGESGSGSVVRAGTNDSGVFWFFNPDNWEALVKVLDGCALNGQVWVFAASTTDLGYSIEVTDTVTGVVRQYVNEPGEPAAAIADGLAFPEGCRR